MNGRPVLRTLAALFLLAGGGQVVGAMGVTGADAGRFFRPEAEPAARTEVRADGLVVREEQEAGEGAPVSEDLQELTAQRIELRLAAQAMKEERQRMEAAKAELTEERSAERARLVALYVRMPSEKSASLLSALPAEDAAGFISAMPTETGAAILAQMSDEMAIDVTEALIARDF